MTFDYVCARRNEIDPKGPCHICIYIYMYMQTHVEYRLDPASM